MKKILIAAVATTFLAQPAIAQDEGSPFAGAYAGVQASAARVTTKHDDQQYWYYGVEDFRQEDSGVQGGVHAGYNFVKGNLLAGVEAEVNFGVLDSYGETTPLDPSYAIGSRTTMLGSVRGKLGVTDGNFAASVNGGYAFSNSKHSYFETDGTDDYFADKGGRSGWVLGFGVDYAVSAKTTLGLAFSHYQFGTKDHQLLDSAGDLNDCSWSDTATADNLCHFPMRDKFETVTVKYSYRF